MGILFAILVIGVFKAILLYQVYHLHTQAELRRRAQAGDKAASSIYKVVSLQPAVDVLIWLAGVGCTAAVLVWSSHSYWWATLLLLAAFSWRIFWAPRLKDGGWLWKFCAFTSRYSFKIIRPLKPLLDPVAVIMPAVNQPQFHKGVYEKEDLLDLLSGQNHLLDNRIPAEDLSIARGALTFGDKKVRDVMTPRKKVRFVSNSEIIGPKLTDELFATGHKMFPVVQGSAKAAQSEVIGTLDIKILLKKLESGGKVESIARHDVYYINEDDSLAAALDAIIKHHHQLLCVVNNFEEIVGTISLNQILSQILGELPTDEFDDHSSPSAVAGHHQSKVSLPDEPLAERVVK